jgi:uncharacterized membrane protein
MPTLVQWIHVTAAVIGVGGMAFLLFILAPSLGALPAEQRDLLAKKVMGRFRWMNWGAIFLLLVSGLYSIRLHYWDVAWGKAWALLTVKIVLALVVFIIASALTLPFKLFDWARARRRIWLSIAFGLAVAVIFIAAYLRPR